MNTVESTETDIDFGAALKFEEAAEYERLVRSADRVDALRDMGLLVGQVAESYGRDQVTAEEVHESLADNPRLQARFEALRRRITRED